MYVYETINLINGKKYIGVKISNRNYDDYLGSGILLNLAIKKYGKESFEKKIIKYFNDEITARNFERSLIEELNAIESDEYYNLVAGGYGGGVTGRKHSDKTKSKISNTRIERGLGPSDEMIKRKMKPILQYDLDGNFIKEFPSKKDAENEVIKSNFGSIKKGEVKYRKGFLWVYKNGDIVNKIITYENLKKEYKFNVSKKSAKLSEDEVLNLIKDRECGLTYREISKKYGISESCGYEIVMGKTYKWVLDGKI